jgi:cation transport ATPase
MKHQLFIARKSIIILIVFTLSNAISLLAAPPIEITMTATEVTIKKDRKVAKAATKSWKKEQRKKNRKARRGVFGRIVLTFFSVLATLFGVFILIGLAFLFSDFIISLSLGIGAGLVLLLGIWLITTINGSRNYAWINFLEKATVVIATLLSIVATILGVVFLFYGYTFLGLLLGLGGAGLSVLGIWLLTRIWGRTY